MQKQVYIMGRKTRDIIEYICFSMVFVCMWSAQTTSVYSLSGPMYLINTVLLSLIIIINRDMIDVHIFNKNIILIEVFALIVVIMGIRFNLIGHIAEGLIIGGIFPLLYMVCSERMMFNIYKAIYTSFFLCIILSLIIAPWGAIRYRGVFVNANGFAIFLIAVFLLSVYQLIEGDRNNKKYKFMVISALAGGFIICTESRAAIIVGIVTLLIWTLFLIKSKLLWKMKYILQTIVVIFISIPIIIASTTFLPNSCFKIEKAIMDDNIIIYDYQKNSEPYKENVKLGGVDNRLNEISSSGRSDLWKIYIEEISIDGHKNAIEYSGQKRTAHNSYIHISYSFGIICGIIFLLIYANAFIKSVYFTLYGKKVNDVFRLTIVVAFGLYSLVESVYFPYSQHLSFLFWFTMREIVIKKTKRCNELIDEI